MVRQELCKHQTDFKSVWVVFPLCGWKTKPSNWYSSFDSTVKSSSTWIPQPSHQSWGAEMCEVSLLGQILVFCSLQSPAEALLGSTARRKTFRETMPSPLSYCLHVGGTEPCGCLQWLSGVITSVLGWKPGKWLPCLALCHGSFLAEATPCPRACLQPAPPASCSLLTELGCHCCPIFPFPMC